ncbi:MAG: heavy metal translocating P-type ATPase [Thermodesulfovibrio sp.]|nr:heavy metal translocating P-type ATPase [Thermodesulfovibrio sp.]
MKKTIEIPIKGMTCAGCAAAVQRALSRVDGVVEASVNLLTGIATVEAEENINIQRVISIVRATGYDIGIKELYLQIPDLDPEIAKLLQEILNPENYKETQGVIEVKTDIINKNVIVSYIPTIIDEEKILSILKKGGIKSQKQTDTFVEEEKKKEFKKLKRDLTISLLLTLPVFVGSMFYIPFLSEGYTQLLFATPVQFIIGARFHKLAFVALRHGTANMNSLISLGTNAAYFYSFMMLLFGPEERHFYFETSTVIITLILFGRTLEEKAKAKTSEAIYKLVQMQPKRAVVVRDGKEQEINIDEVLPGDIVVVKQSEKIPVDGLIVEGSASIDESMITGESVPVDKSVGEKVVGGTILLSGILKVEAKAVGKEAFLGQIIKLIQDAQTRKPPVQRLADKISAIFVPAVLAVAVLTFILWILFKGEFSIALSNSIAVLIIACPCALGLATPTAIMVATGRAAKEGILIRNIEKLEELGRIEILFSDKTGTLTEGKPEVKNTQYFKMDKSEILKLVATAEKYSEHPLAKAILKYCMKEEINSNEPEEFEITAGGGVLAWVYDSKGVKRKILVGSSKFMQKKNIALPETLSSKPSTTVYAAVDEEIKAVFFIADPVREESYEVIKELQKMGIEVILITGDSESVAKAVAEELGIKRVFAGVLPDEKAKIIRKFRVVERKNVAMIGDGINDAPALSEATVGIAMGSGTDIAIHTADITLMKGGLKGVPALIKLSKITVRIIKENLFWAFIYNIIGIPIAAGVLYLFGGPLLNPMIASLAMSLSSVSVVSNSLRLKTKEI